MSYLRFVMLAVALFAALFASPAFAEDADIKRFNTDVRVLVPDWYTDGWDNGFLKIHPEKFNQYADNYYMTLVAEELPDGRTPQQVLEEYFEGIEVGDVSDEVAVSMKGASNVAEGILLKMHIWGSFEGRMASMYGIITTKKGRYLRFYANCNLQKPDRYDGENCLRSIILIGTALQKGALVMPRPEAPIYLAGWSGRHYDNGISVLRRFLWSGSGSFGRDSSITASPPRTISAAGERAAVLAFADRHKYVIDGDPAAPSWDGAFMTRAFPGASEGPSYQLAVAVPTPDDKKIILVIRCYNEKWAKLCTEAMQQQIKDIKSGLVQERLAKF